MYGMISGLNGSKAKRQSYLKADFDIVTLKKRKLNNDRKERRH